MEYSEYIFTIFPYKLWLTREYAHEILNECFNLRIKDTGYEFNETNCPISSGTLAFTVSAIEKSSFNEGVLISFLKSRKTVKLSIIAHEADHAATDLCEYFGVNPTMETHAYLVQYIVSCALDYLKGKVKLE